MAADGIRPRVLPLTQETNFYNLFISLQTQGIDDHVALLVVLNILILSYLLIVTGCKSLPRYKLRLIPQAPFATPVQCIVYSI